MDSVVVTTSNDSVTSQHSLDVKTLAEILHHV